ncbi:MAG: hypothetical protein U0Y10_02185 [Spirosomataceae bacterium]
MITATATGSNPCVGRSIDLSSTPSGGTYSWSGSSSFNSILQNPSRSNATTSMSGVYSVTVSSSGCSASATVSVVVNQVGASASSNSPVCAGGSINLNASTGGTSYSWSEPSSFTSTAQNPTRSSATTGMSGVYSVTVNGSSGCTGTATTSVVVNANPVPVASAPASVCAGASLCLTASGGGTYSWRGDQMDSVALLRFHVGL